MRTRGLVSQILLSFIILLAAFYSATYLDSRYLRDWAAEANGVE